MYVLNHHMVMSVSPVAVDIKKIPPGSDNDRDRDNDHDYDPDAERDPDSVVSPAGQQ